MNIILIGYRGTGKSEVSFLLSDALGMKRIGMDDEIVKTADLSIPEIVKRDGWDGFRDLEAETARRVSRLENVIIDTGGGVIERTENIMALKEKGLVFWLKAPVDVIVRRIESGTERPALTQGESFTDEVSDVLKKRLPKYSAAADHEIDTDGVTPHQIADEIIEIWKNAGNVS